jgi:hypothetical protein
MAPIRECSGSPSDRLPSDGVLSPNQFTASSGVERDPWFVKPKEHHFPAVLTAQFGKAPRSGKRAGRKRIVAMARRGETEIREATAESVGWSGKSRRLYDLPDTDDPGATIDGLWAYAERRLPPLVESLKRYRPENGLSLDLFYRVLVPISAQLMVRHPEFESRYADRVRSCAETHGHRPLDVNARTVNLARNVDYLCLCGLLARRRWWVLSSPQPLVTSELGYCGLLVKFGDDRFEGYLVPLHRNVAVYICTGEASKIEGGAACLDRRTLTPAETLDANRGMASWSPAGIFGDDRAVRAAARVWREQDRPSPLAREVPGALVGDDGLSVEYAEQYLRSLHDAQDVMEPGHPCPRFDDCSTCQGQVAWLRSLFAAHDRSHDEALSG